MAEQESSWAGSFRDITEKDETIQAMGKYFTCTYLLDMEKHKVIIAMHDGKVKEINTRPGPVDAYDFAIRASHRTWTRFASETPPPMCHGIWAMTFREDMKLEGNLLVLMQNLRNITVQLELLRRTGLPA